MKRALITGANGFIGRALTRRLLSEGLEVRAVTRDGAKLGIAPAPGLKVIEADFTRYKDLPELAGEKGFDAFFHLAWAGYGTATNDPATQTANILAACEAAAAAARLGAEKFILAGSSHEFQKNYYQHDTRREAGLCSVYGAAKRAAQRLCAVIAHNAGMRYNGVLFAHVFGPGDRSRRSANLIISRMLKGEDIDLIAGDNLYDWTYIDDVTGGLAAVMAAGKPGAVYYVGSGTLRPFKDIVRTVREILRANVRLNFGRYPDTAYIDYTRIDLYQLYRDTGYLAGCDFAQSIKNTADWVRTLNF